MQLAPLRPAARRTRSQRPGARASKLYSCCVISSPALRVNSASASSTGVSNCSKPNRRETAANSPNSHCRTRRSSGRKSRVPGRARAWSGAARPARHAGLGRASTASHRACPFRVLEPGSAAGPLRPAAAGQPRSSSIHVCPRNARMWPGHRLAGASSGRQCCHQRAGPQAVSQLLPAHWLKHCVSAAGRGAHLGVAAGLSGRPSPPVQCSRPTCAPSPSPDTPSSAVKQQQHWYS